MQVKINGLNKNLDGSPSLKEVVEQFTKDCSRVIAEVNGQIIKNPSWEQTRIEDGDSIELVTFVGGG